MVLIHDENGTSVNFLPNSEAGPLNLTGVVEYILPTGSQQAKTQAARLRLGCAAS
jgi:hypothetical protein